MCTHELTSDEMLKAIIEGWHKLSLWARLRIFFIVLVAVVKIKLAKVFPWLKH